MITTSPSTRFDRQVILTVVVSALGYFVDIYDLLLFGIVRVPSLKAIGVADADMLTVGVRLLNMQMAGMLLGGIIWGIAGDLKGRKSVLFGSILLYSLANIANAFVTSPEAYAWLRLAAGIGLAGELGAAVTLVSEVMSKEDRGLGTAVVASVGILGAVAASLIGDFFDWKVAYLVGGVMGLSLLALRAGLVESGMFRAMSQSTVGRGRFHQIFLQPQILFRYVNCILVGLPIWFMIGVLITFAPELAKEVGVQGTITGSKAIMWCYAGGSIGDLSAGLLCQKFRSRRRGLLVFLMLSLVMLLTYISQRGWSESSFYTLCFGLGLATGYWAVFATVAAEQFGTNIRATVATTAPNFVRGSVVPVTLALTYLSKSHGLLNATTIVGGTVLALAFVALYFLPETFGKNLDYFETL